TKTNGTGGFSSAGNNGGAGVFNDVGNGSTFKGAAAGGGGSGVNPLPPKDMNGNPEGTGLGKGGTGADGDQFLIEGTPIYYGAGGGGVGYNFEGNPLKPGIGGLTPVGTVIGGTGSDGIGSPGTDLTGSGGGAGRSGGGKGGNGVVYITYYNYSILEVEYLYFEAKYNSDNRSGKLTWATSKEWENSHFEIERAVNNLKTWTKIGEVNGQGYSDTTVEYNFTDTELPAVGGNIFYRLKQVDMDGDFSYSVTRSIQVNALEGTTAWIAYPNPSDIGSSVTVALLDDSGYTDGTIQIRVSDIRGIFQTYTVQNPEDVSAAVNSYLENARPGMYIVQLFWGDKSEQMKLVRK
ncbi:MAG TPA: T9SS type A sorting domain-containing protein, partial [Algoriphagus sp.]|nr:T9SS type A sorting domain-containing protein [Algoriphagus sp.]